MYPHLADATLAMQVAVSWSGGKDSCLASWQALKQGHRISHLLTMVSREFQRTGAHGVHREVMEAQARALGLPLVLREFERDNYEAIFKEALRRLRAEGVAALVTGDIHLQESRDWTARVCLEVGLEPITPLWGLTPREVMDDLLAEGFRAVVVSAQAQFLGTEWVGRWLDAKGVADLEELGMAKGVDLCGERGEYHTLVVDGPLFRSRLDLLETGAVLRDGYWFLDIKRYDLRPKREGE